jgi:hypothetical protein
MEIIQHRLVYQTHRRNIAKVSRYSSIVLFSINNYNNLLFVCQDLNLMKSPTKKQLLVSIANGQNGNRPNTKSADIYHVVGKSAENIYEKVSYFMAIII